MAAERTVAANTRVRRWLCGIARSRGVTWRCGGGGEGGGVGSDDYSDTEPALLSEEKKEG